MAESSKIFCEPCEHDGTSAEATVWCNDCCEGFCVECVKGHKLTKLLRHHHIITVADHLETSDLNVSQTCGQHSKPFDTFCPQHDELLCLRCIQLHHSNCEDLLRIDEAVKGVKTSTALADLDDQINTLLQNISRGLDLNTENRKNIEVQKGAIKSTINDTRAMINKKLDELQEKLLDQLETIYTETALDLDKVKDCMHDNEKRVLALKTQLNGLRTHASDMQTFIGMKMLVTEVYSEKEDFNANTKNFHPNIQLSINSSIYSVFNDLNELGEIVLQNQCENSHYMEPQNRQAQLDVVEVFDVTNACLEKTRTLNLQKGKHSLHIQGCVILNSGFIVFADFLNKRLILHDQNGTFNREITISKSPKYITTVNEDEVAVSYQRPTSHVDVINLTTKKAVTKLSASSTKWHNALCFYDETFFIAVKNEGINELTRDGVLKKSFLSHVMNIGTICMNDNHFYYSISSGKTLYCTDLEGNPIWEFSDDRLYRADHAVPFAIDGLGNVFAISFHSSVVLGISFDGKNHAVLLTEEDGLDNPRAIFCDRQNSRLLVCNEKNAKAFVFDVKTK